jgi:aryl-alcohol dehydrogenase-like predicted oxidoreductase
MERRVLGRTGLEASVMGIGSGGPSRLGQRTGASRATSVQIVRRGLELGVNFIDTAEGYGTEEIVGEAIRGWDRSSLVLSTKKSTRGRVTRAEVRSSLNASLKRLGTDYIDIYLLHAVTPGIYESMASEIHPEMEALRNEGLIRFIGVTEFFNRDTRHEMLERALDDGIWDVIMVGFNVLNQSARLRVLPRASKEGVATLVMFAVRRALSRTERLTQVVGELIARGEVEKDAFDPSDPLGFVVKAGAASMVDASYRFCRDEPGVSVVLSGTGDISHLEENVRSFNRPPLPPDLVLSLRRIFGRVDSVTGE